MDKKNYLTLGLMAVILVSFVYAGSQFLQLTNPNNEAQVLQLNSNVQVQQYSGAAVDTNVGSTDTGSGGIGRYIIAFTSDRQDHSAAIAKEIAKFPGNITVVHSYSRVLNGAAISGNPLPKTVADQIATDLHAKVIVDATAKAGQYKSIPFPTGDLRLSTALYIAETTAGLGGSKNTGTTKSN